MERGSILGGRFELLGMAGRGGMGSIHRARDVKSGSLVAVKMMATGGDAERFNREARMLASLEHPGIVRYVAHCDDALLPYLVMDWIEGESLEQRLRSGGALSIDDALGVARRTAGALAYAHEQGIVHRDVKPSNLMLPDGDPQRVTLVDFGVARGSRSLVRTRTGMAIGTPGYMAPEQIRGERNVDARADVFALGCVMFECLAGRPLFSGDHVIAILAKVLIEDPPSIDELPSDVPDGLVRLLEQMVAKPPASRPANGRAVSDALVGLSVSEVSCTTALSADEQVLLCVILVAFPAPPVEPLVEESTSDIEEGATLPALAPDPLEIVRRAADPFEGMVESLADDSALVILRGEGSVCDAASHAAQLALELRNLLPGSRLSLASGRAHLSRRGAVGEAIDRAARLLTGDDKIRLDAATEELLSSTVECIPEGESFVLVGRVGRESERTVLGRRTPFVGRDAELGVVLTLFDQCRAQSEARAIIVTAAAGIGKSRLRDEILNGLSTRKEPPRVLSAFAAKLAAGSPLSILGQLVRSAADIRTGEAADSQRARLARYVSQLPHREDLDRAAEFLGELAGVPFDARDDVQLRAARSDPRLMKDRIRIAWHAMVDAECEGGTLVLVLEDLHWGDRATVDFIGSALDVCEARPLLVLATARPEVEAAFPALWSDAALHRIELRALPRRAATRLARAILDDSSNDNAVTALVELAGGNPFYLEEMIRCEAARGEMVRSYAAQDVVERRLSGLSIECRRVLRAASIFGERTTLRGLELLLTSDLHGIPLDEALRTLIKSEVLVPGDQAEFETAVRFRHALVQEAAYAMLTEQDRALGHRLAAEFLEEEGSVDAEVLAQHYERAGLQCQAAEHHFRAAYAAIDAGAYRSAVVMAERGLACNPVDELRGRLCYCHAFASLTIGLSDRLRELGEEALALLPRGSDLWFDTARMLSAAASRRNDVERLLTLSQDLHEVLSHASALSDSARAAAGICAQCCFLGGAVKDGTRLLTFVDVEGFEHRARWTALGARAAVLGDPEEYRRCHLAAACHEAATGGVSAGRVEEAWARVSAAYALIELGDPENAIVELNALRAAMGGRPLGAVLPCLLQNLALAHFRAGRLGHARQDVQEAMVILAGIDDKRLLGLTRVYLGLILIAEARHADAEVEARGGVGLLVGSPLIAFATAVLARALRVSGSIDAALEAATEAMSLLEAAGGMLEEGDAMVRLELAEAKIAARDTAGARVCILRARDRLRVRAAYIKDAAWQVSFLEQVPENARTISLAKTLEAS